MSLQNIRVSRVDEFVARFGFSCSSRLTVPIQNLGLIKTRKYYRVKNRTGIIIILLKNLLLKSFDLISNQKIINPFGLKTSLT